MATESDDPSSDFSSLLGRGFRPEGEAKSTRAEQAADTLAAQALEGSATISDATSQSVEALIARIDAKLGEQVGAILHHPDFVRLESTWGALEHFVTNAFAVPRVHLLALDVSRDELGEIVEAYAGRDWSEGPLLRPAYEVELDDLHHRLASDPRTMDVGPLLDLLRRLAAISVSEDDEVRLSPRLPVVERWQLLVGALANVDFVAWCSVRTLSDARSIALPVSVPGRLTYGRATEPVEDFEYEEDFEGERKISGLLALMVRQDD